MIYQLGFIVILVFSYVAVTSAFVGLSANSDKYKCRVLRIVDLSNFQLTIYLSKPDSSD